MLQVIYLRKKTLCFQTNKQTKARTKIFFFLPAGSRRDFYISSENFSLVSSVRIFDDR